MSVSKTFSPILAAILAAILSAALASCVSTPSASDADGAKPLDGDATTVQAAEPGSTKASASLDAELDALVAKARDAIDANHRNNFV